MTFHFPFFLSKKEKKLLLTPERPCVETDEGRNKTSSSTCLNATFLDRKEVLHTTMLPWSPFLFCAAREASLILYFFWCGAQWKLVINNNLTFSLAFLFALAMLMPHMRLGKFLF